MSALAVRPGILDIQPYKGGEFAVSGVKKAIKLSSNEGALGPSPAAMEAFRKAATSLDRYPDGHCVALRAALANRYGLDASRIVCGAGSDELLGLLCRAYAGPGDEVLYSQHGFLIYPISARSVGATPVWAPETNLTTNVDALLAKVTARTRVLFIANPNNPTGTYLPADELRRLRDNLRPDILLVIDAAYAEYVGRNDYTAGEDLVEAYDNVVMTRTFSKMFGLGGLRLGWGYFPTAIADVLNRIRMPFNVSGPAQAAGIAALEDFAFVEKVRANNDQWHPWTAERLRAIGIDVPETVGNFLLLRFPQATDRDAAAADLFLKSRGLILRMLGGYGLADSLRLTIGTGEQMKLVVDALGDFMRR